MAKLWQFSRSHSKPAFSKKKKRGDQEKFFKNFPKSRPRLKHPKAHLHKWHYPLNSMHLKGQDLKKILWQKSASTSSRTTKLWQFWHGRPKPAFSEKVQRGTKENFSKLAQKDALAEKAQKHTVANGIIL